VEEMWNKISDNELQLFSTKIFSPLSSPPPALLL